MPLGPTDLLSYLRQNMDCTNVEEGACTEQHHPTSASPWQPTIQLREEPLRQF